MTRTLPWKRKSELASPTPSAARSSPTTISNPGSSFASKKKHISLARRTGRSPSTSPPPAPPVESFMIGGLENDDKYRMVEDEFVSVAGLFTAHLHAAEYQRQKEVAKKQNADTIRSISRPVVGGMTDAVRRRRDALNRISKQHTGIHRAIANSKASGNESDDDEGDDSVFAGTSLQGLMSSSQKVSAPLTTLTTAASSTRAAAGYQERSKGRHFAASRSEETDEDLDDPVLSSRHITAATSRPPRTESMPSKPVTRPVPTESRQEKDLSDGSDSDGLLRRARERRAVQNSRRQSRKSDTHMEDQVSSDMIPPFL